jgi:hypothetical protein
MEFGEQAKSSLMGMARHHSKGSSSEADGGDKLVQMEILSEKSIK